jgi:hypothetical protein
VAQDAAKLSSSKTITRVATTTATATRDRIVKLTTARTSVPFCVYDRLGAALSAGLPPGAAAPPSGPSPVRRCAPVSAAGQQPCQLPDGSATPRRPPGGRLRRLGEPAMVVTGTCVWGALPIASGGAALMLKPNGTGDRLRHRLLA